MEHKNPPFTITNAMISDIVAIAELVGRITVTNMGTQSPMLRRKNRIQSIHGSLAIEQNTLTVEQMTAVINGKQVIAPPKDIAEVKNAFEIYEHLEDLNPYSSEDLLTAHGIMMRGLLEEAGMFRSGNVGIVNKDGQVLHMGTLPQYVPDLVWKLLDWTETSDVHPLIKSCVFHYEFELIHPFGDGNGRVGRLWHTLLLATWNPLFAWLPVESMIYKRQQAYYDAINRSNFAGDSTAFIEFMLDTIKASLTDATSMSDGMSDGLLTTQEERKQTILTFLEQNVQIQNKDVQSLCAVSPASANRILRQLTDEGILSRKRVKGIWVYEKTGT